MSAGAHTIILEPSTCKGLLGDASEGKDFIGGTSEWKRSIWEWVNRIREGCSRELKRQGERNRYALRRQHALKCAGGLP